MNTTIESATARETGLVGVSTTGVYCRPGCKALERSRPDHRVALVDESTARQAGYRPCRTCRPDAVETLRFGVGPSPFGPLFVALSARGVVALGLLETDEPGPCVDRLRHDFPGAQIEGGDAEARQIARRAVAYVREGRSCDDLPLDLRGTPFQLRVWEALRRIPRGSTTSYGALARSLGLPRAARAVGAACGANRIALIVPCHRVLSHAGGLGGFYYGLDVKQALLEAEGALAAGRPPRV